jgi:hypothetical protein
VRRSVYFAFFDRLAETSTPHSNPAPPPNTRADQAPSSLFCETTALEAGLETEQEGLRQNGVEERLDRERSELDSLEQERHVLDVNGDSNDEQGADDSIRVPESDQRRNTEIDFERIIVGGHASIP